MLRDGAEPESLERELREFVASFDEWRDSEGVADSGVRTE
jgi:hypothetical protein